MVYPIASPPRSPCSAHPVFCEGEQALLDDSGLPRAHGASRALDISRRLVHFLPTLIRWWLRRMHGTHDYLAGLAQIHARESVEERRALWRRP